MRDNKQRVTFPFRDIAVFPCGPSLKACLALLLLGGQLISRGSAIRAAATPRFSRTCEASRPSSGFCTGTASTFTGRRQSEGQDVPAARGLSVPHRRGLRLVLRFRSDERARGSTQRPRTVAHAARGVCGAGRQITQPPTPHGHDPAVRGPAGRATRPGRVVDRRPPTDSSRRWCSERTTCRAASPRGAPGSSAVPYRATWSASWPIRSG